MGLIPKRGKEPSTVYPRSVRRGGTIRSTPSWMLLQSMIHGIRGETLETGTDNRIRCLHGANPIPRYGMTTGLQLSWPIPAPCDGI